MRLLDYREVLAASVEMALKDHENGNTISHSDFMNRIKEERGWKQNSFKSGGAPGGVEVGLT